VYEKSAIFGPPCNYRASSTPLRIGNRLTGSGAIVRVAAYESHLDCQWHAERSGNSSAMGQDVIDW